MNTQKGKFGIIVDGVTHLVVDDNKVLWQEEFPNACEKYCSLYKLCYSDSTNESCIAYNIVAGMAQVCGVGGVHFEEERSHTDACKEESFC